MTRKMWFAGVIALAAGLLAPATSQAAFAIRFLTAPGGTVLQTITDGGAGDNSAASNSISFSGNVGGFEISLSGGTTDNPGSGASSNIATSINALKNLSTSASATITYEISANGFFSPLSPATAFTTGTATFNAPALAGDTVTQTSFFNDSDVLFASQELIGVSSFVTKPATGVPSSGTFTGNQEVVNYVVPYSLTQRYTFSIGANNTSLERDAGISGRLDVLGIPGTINPAPVPATAVMLLAATPILGLARRLRRGSVGAPLVV